MPSQHSSGDLLADRRYAYAEACLAEGDARGAAEMAEQALDLAPRFAPAWLLLGRAREALHAASRSPADLQGALGAYANALDLDPEDRLGSRLRLAQLGVGDRLAAISPAYVRALFDGYAARFERHLVGDLGYRGPEMLRAALDAVAGPERRFARALDLGCGTGLMGAALAGRVGRLDGVDLSPRMLARAERRGLYHGLVSGDLADALAGTEPGSLDLAVAADVFIYLGDLRPVLAAVARALAPAGLCAFTVQSHGGPGVTIGEDGRYAHSDAEVLAAAAAAGLAPRHFAEGAIRRQNGRGVPGRVVVLGLPDTVA
ncbi:class I SAM-dependent DNA methyltransferase [Methylobacterium oxalidis]|uniref:Methyltransferase n=1 Tax=Methylobacterium oxalidis TaxID=944322 RepID=A0A512J4U5_9HYPH|nr:methyltransferase domain-containing protein [Methylobacterium oxalidis]GEP04974.1 methyltransferase [Methylobacterium oxalidis]GJE32365.1 Trans-aconitate 2-methyltransferase [Methylobacterium oxalidis]GLS63711.1 methyltransferase [Methylobacterium oxalidis]